MLRRLMSKLSTPSRGPSLVDPEISAPPMTIDPEWRAVKMVFPSFADGSKIAIDRWLDELTDVQGSPARITVIKDELGLLNVRALWHCRSGGLKKPSSGK